MRTVVLLCMLVLGAWLLSGCSIQKQQPEKLKDLEYTILTEQEIPEEFHQMLEEKKENPMMLTYLDQDALYLGVGYGVQPTAGYSIVVESLYLSPDGIYLDTTLIGPGADEMVAQVETYPYLVLRMERREESVIFE